jgi:hypothetical protein
MIVAIAMTVMVVNDDRNDCISNGRNRGVRGSRDYDLEVSDDVLASSWNHHILDNYAFVRTSATCRSSVYVSSRLGKG